MNLVGEICEMFQSRGKISVLLLTKPQADSIAPRSLGPD